MDRLKIRRDFVSAARGRRVSRRAFVLQARKRGDAMPARIGFTVTKRTAKKAVERNRIRRRLKAAVRSVPAHMLQPGVDHVLIGRRPALTMAFDDLKGELQAAWADLAGQVEQASISDHGRRDGARRPADGTQ